MSHTAEDTSEYVRLKKHPRNDSQSYFAAEDPYRAVKKSSTPSMLKK